MEYNSNFYDDMYDAGGYDGVYDLPTKKSFYYPLYLAVTKEIEALPRLPILEVGAGTGGLAELLLKAGLPYSGFDFSSKAIKKARIRVGSDDCLFVRDAYDRDSYNEKYGIIICTEVLEHIENDIAVIKNWRIGSHCVCSVPNFDSKSHVRFFRDTRQVAERYSSVINITNVQKIKKPSLADISIMNYVRHLIWYRYRPDKLMHTLGFSTFSSAGGWFLFTGIRK